MKWRRDALGGWITLGGEWRLRPVREAPDRGRQGRRWWLYRRGSRYTPTGYYVDAVSFDTAAEGKLYAKGRADT